MILLSLQILFPLLLTDLIDTVDVYIETYGGGSSGQAHSARQALSLSLRSFVGDNMRIKLKMGKFFFI